MKKIILSLILGVFALSGYAQMNTFGGIGSRVNDTTTYQTNAAAYHAAGYYDMYFNNQATNDHWDFWNGSSYTHVFDFNSGSFTLTNGNGTTANGTAVDLGDATAAPFTITIPDNGITGQSDLFMGGGSVGMQQNKLGSSTVYSNLYAQNDGNAYIESTNGAEIFGLQAQADNKRFVFLDGRTDAKGIEYAADYSADFRTHSLVDSLHVANAIAAAGGGTDEIITNTQTGTSYTLVLTDQNKLVYMTNVAANTVTFPANASVAFPDGALVYITYEDGVTTLDPDPGVTLDVTNIDLDVPCRLCIVTAVQSGIDNWIVQNGTPGGAGAVSSVDVSGGTTGLTTSGGPITTSGTITITGDLDVDAGGTGVTSLTAYAPLFGGTTSTGDVQSGTVGTAGQVMTSNGAGVLPTFQTPAAGFTNPMTTLGDIIYENATPAAARLAGNTSATKMFLNQTGNGSISAAPAWSALVSGDIPALAYWASTGTTTLSGTTTITGSAPNRLNFNGTFTATANGDAARVWSSSITGTGTAGHNIYGDRHANAIVAGANQNLFGDWFAPLLTSGGFAVTGYGIGVEGPTTATVGTSYAGLFRAGGNTSTAYAVRFESAAQTLLANFRADGANVIGPATMGGFNSTFTTPSPTGNQFQFAMGSTPDSGGSSIRFYNSANITSTSGIRAIVGIYGNTFAPTSGTAELDYVQFGGVINQTSTASGIIRIFDATQLTLTSVLGNIDVLRWNPVTTSVTGGYFGIHMENAAIRNGWGLGAGINSSAKMHIGASATGANTASLKINEGSRQTTPEDGSINYVANNIEFVETSTVYILSKTLTNTATLDFGSTIAGAVTDLTLTVTGAADGDAVTIGVPNASYPATGTFTAWVSAANTVTIRYANNSLTLSQDPASGTFRASVIKY